MKKITLTLGLIAGMLFTQAQEKEFTPEEIALQNWYHVNYDTDNVYGVGSDDVYTYAASKNLKSSPVVVAVIDSGIETDHPDLIDNIWINKDEIPDNGIDDDNNGYIDDVNGWNFIGGADGNVDKDNLELTRLYRDGLAKFETKDAFTNKTNQEKYPAQYKQFQEIKEEFNKELSQNKMILASIEASVAEQANAFDVFTKEYGANKKVTVEGLRNFKPTSELASKLKQGFESKINQEGASEIFGFTGEEIKAKFLEEAKGATDYYGTQVNYYLNPDFDPRSIVGDNYDDKTEKYYGNNTMEGPDALHGTHVAGIIGAVRNNGIGMNGVAENVKIMNIRTVPDGDERDKDVANAIRYAVDNGAKIINMSFGKAYSPSKEIVWDAIKYATENGVLMVHAAGNDNKDIDTEHNFPTNYDENGKMISDTWITVGASTRYNDRLKASFSNYGKKQIDIFAPGLEIYSTVPDSKYKFLQGTSMASPVVAGVAALVWSYFPNLTAQEIRAILISTGNKSDSLSDISTNGVVVDAAKAFKEAEKMSANKMRNAKFAPLKRKG